MLSLGLCVRQYGFNEDTQSALVLANCLSARADVRVSIYSSLTPKPGVDTRWDKKISSPDREPFDKWVERNSSIAWFHINKIMLKEATKLKNKRNVLMLNWSSFTTNDANMIKHFDSVVVPEVSVSKWFEERFPKIPYVRIPWCSGVPTIKKKIHDSKSVGMLVTLTSSSCEKYGNLLFYVLEDMLKEHSGLTITVGYNRVGEPSTWAVVNRIAAEKQERFTLVYRPNLLERLKLHETNDWLLWPAPCESTGITGLESMSCGTPVVGLDVPVVSDIIRNGKNGVLIGCDIEETALSVPVAYPKLHHLVDGIENVLYSKYLLDDVMGEAWPELDKRAEEFNIGWSTLLGVTV